MAGIKYEQWEDDIIIKYNFPTARKKLPKRSYTSIKSRKEYLTEKGAKFLDEYDTKVPNKPSYFIVPGLDKFPTITNAYTVMAMEILNITPEELKSDCREAHLTTRRMLISYFLRYRVKLGVTEIAKIIGKNHSTISYYCKAVNNALEVGDREIVEGIKQLEQIKF